MSFSFQKTKGVPNPVLQRGMTYEEKKDKVMENVAVEGGHTTS
jgi:hypothetical protein